MMLATEQPATAYRGREYRLMRPPSAKANTACPSVENVGGEGMSSSASSRIVSRPGAITGLPVDLSSESAARLSRHDVLPWSRVKKASVGRPEGPTVTFGIRSRTDRLVAGFVAEPRQRAGRDDLIPAVGHLEPPDSGRLEAPLGLSGCLQAQGDEDEPLQLLLARPDRVGHERAARARLDALPDHRAR